MHIAPNALVKSASPTCPRGFWTAQQSIAGGSSLSRDQGIAQAKKNIKCGTIMKWTTNFVLDVSTAVRQQILHGAQHRFQILWAVEDGLFDVEGFGICFDLLLRRV